MYIKRKCVLHQEHVPLLQSGFDFGFVGVFNSASQNDCKDKAEAFIISHKKEINDLDDEQYALLHYAVKFNRENVVQLLLSHGADANVKGLDGMTPLHMAAKLGHVTLVQLLISKGGAFINEKNDIGQVALHYACRRGNCSIVQILLNNGADINSFDEDNNTPLHFCALQSSLEIAQLLVKNGANVIARDISGITPIMLAAAEGAIALVQLFLETAKAQNQSSEKEALEAYDDEGSNSLHFAVQNNQIKLITFITDYGVDPDCGKCSGFRALHLAAAAGLVQIAKILLNRGANVSVTDSNCMTPLHICALHNNCEIAKDLVDFGADVHAKANDMTYPIHCAARKGATEILSFLLSVGADSSCQDAQMRTPLHCAVQSNHINTVEELLNDSSLDKFLNLTDQNQQTALHYAARRNCSSIVNLLLQMGASYSLKDSEEKSALHLAAEYGNEQCVKYLLDGSREETNDNDIDGCTPLMLAAYRGHVKVIQILMDNGADITIRDDSRRSALMLAAKHGHDEVLKTLLENNAAVNDFDKAKNSALHFATKHGHVNCVKILVQHQAMLTKNLLNLTPLNIAIEDKNSKICAIFFHPNCWKSAMKICDENGHSPMKSLIENVPDIAVEVLNNCVEYHGADVNDLDFTIRYIYKYIDPGPFDKSSTKVRYFALNTMIDTRRQVLLKHPVVQTLLDQKWKRFARYFFYVEFLLYCFYVILLTAYVVENEPPTSENYDAEGCAIHNTSLIINDEEGLEHHLKSSVVAMEMSLYTLLVLNVLHHVIKMIFQRYRYFLNPSIFAFWSLYIMTFLFIYPPLTEACVFQWQMGALSCFLAWCFLIIYLRQIKYFSLYVLMFNKVLISMIKTMFIFIFFIIAFGMAFYIMLARQKTFQDLHFTIIRIFTMALGELDFVDILVESNNKPFGDLAEIIYFIFLFLMPIVLMNLMVGIAVGDIDTIKQDAYVEKIKLQVDYIYDLEMKLPLWLQQKLHQPYFDFKPNRYKAKPLTKIIKFLFNVDKTNVFIVDEKKSLIQDLLEEYATNLKEINTNLNQLKDIISKNDALPFNHICSTSKRKRKRESSRRLSLISNTSAFKEFLDDIKTPK